MTMTEQRVLFDDCEYSDAQELMYEGQPFSGVVIEEGLRGQLLTERHFRQGIPDGLSRIWYHDGTLKQESEFAFGMRRYHREWYPNGRPRRALIYDPKGHPVSDNAWDETGREIEAST